MPALYLTTRDGKRIPLRHPHPIDVHAHRTALTLCPSDGPYIAVSLIGSMGAIRQRRSGMHHADYAILVVEQLSAVIDCDELIRQADAIAVEALNIGELIPGQAEVEELGESSGRTGASCSTASVSPDTGGETLERG